MQVTQEGFPCEQGVVVAAAYDHYKSRLLCLAQQGADFALVAYPYSKDTHQFGEGAALPLPAAAVPRIVVTKEHVTLLSTQGKMMRFAGAPLAALPEPLLTAKLEGGRTCVYVLTAHADAFVGYDSTYKRILTLATHRCLC